MQDNTIKSDVYKPSDDSYLLSETLKERIPKIKNYENQKYIEVGCGGGIQLETLNRLGIKKQNIFSCDINPKAVERCKEQGFNSVISDLFSNISKNKKFDVIIFNPPYLPDSEDNPESEESKTITTGGKTGSEIINRFLKETKDYLNKNGIIFLVTSSLTKNINWKGFNKEQAGEKSLFFEKLYVWKLMNE